MSEKQERGRPWGKTARRERLFRPIKRDPPGIAALRAYLNAKPRATQQQFAARCGLTLASLRRVLWRGRCTSELALAIEKASGAEITRDLLFPDWTAIWPEWSPAAPQNPRGEARRDTDVGSEQMTLAEMLAADASRQNYRLAVEVLLPEIEDALAQGFTLTAAWRGLRKQGRVECCLATFKKQYRAAQRRRDHA